MTYVNIPESNLAGGIATIVGKMTGNLSDRISTAAAGMAFKLREGNLSRPTTRRLRNKHQKLSSNVTKINRRVKKINRMAKSIQRY